MSDSKTRRNNPGLAQKYALMAVPTGIGASVGGYAGDASLAARKIAEKIPLIVNPNVVNAAVFSGITNRMLYVEGWSMTEFVRGNLGLIPSFHNKIGVIFDKSIPENVLNIHINTINAIKTVYGIDITGYEITGKPVGVDFFTTENDISSGAVDCPQTLNDYESGEGVDIVGGVEAVISHYVSKELFCPCVHAPAFADVSIQGSLVSPKCSAEYITPTFLPCLMFGLDNAPLFAENTEKAVTKKNLDAVLMPCDSLGGSIVFDAIKNDIPVYAVKENKTVLNVDKKALGLEKITELETYDDFIRLLN